MENIQTVESGKIEPDAMVQEIETGGRQFRAAFTGEHGIKPVAYLMQIQHITGSIFCLCLAQFGAPPVGRLLRF